MSNRFACTAAIQGLWHQRQKSGEERKTRKESRKKRDIWKEQDKQKAKGWMNGRVKVSKQERKHDSAPWGRPAKEGGEEEWEGWDGVIEGVAGYRVAVISQAIAVKLTFVPLAVMRQSGCPHLLFFLLLFSLAPFSSLLLSSQHPPPPSPSPPPLPLLLSVFHIRPSARPITHAWRRHFDWYQTFSSQSTPPPHPPCTHIAHSPQNINASISLLTFACAKEEEGREGQAQSKLMRNIAYVTLSPGAFVLHKLQFRKINQWELFALSSRSNK